jgi:hypothetical protein
LYDKARILLLTGSAGGGKSRCAAEKIHAYMLKYPEATGLVLRKAREFATKSIVPFMRRNVIGQDPAVTYRKADGFFDYYNGSSLYWGGMRNDDQREAIRSMGADGSFDIVWIEEANAFKRDDFDELLARMRGKAANWTQIILTTNPDAPNHWIHQDLILGKGASVYYSSAADNPHNPPEYIESLSMMTGTLYDRLVLGKWVQAEGAVYPHFGAGNITTDEPDLDRPFELAFDDGYAVDPRAILFVQRQPDQVLVFDEIYHLQKLEEESIGAVLERCVDYAGENTPDDWRAMSLSDKSRWCAKNDVPLPELAVGSSEANQLMRRFRMANIPARGGTHRPRTEGVKILAGLVKDANSEQILQVNARCKEFVNEMQGYKLKEGKDEPEDGDDHGPDALRYWCYLRMRRV